MRETFNPEKFMEVNSIDQHNLIDGMAQNSALLGYYGTQAALWRAAFDNFKLQIEVRSSEIALDLKNAGTKVSQGTADETVACHDDVKKLKRAQLASKEQLDLYTNAMNAIEDRGRMLGSIGAWKRQEMSGMHLGSIPGFDPTKTYPAYSAAPGAPTVMPLVYGAASTVTNSSEKLNTATRADILAKLSASEKSSKL